MAILFTKRLIFMFGTFYVTYLIQVWKRKCAQILPVRHHLFLKKYQNIFWIWKFVIKNWSCHTLKVNANWIRTTLFCKDFETLIHITSLCTLDLWELLGNKKIVKLVVSLHESSLLYLSLKGLLGYRHIDSLHSMYCVQTYFGSCHITFPSLRVFSSTLSFHCLRNIESRCPILSPVGTM